MLIDWFTVGAQIVNFLVLVVLLRRFLYRPILAAIDQRESKISGEIADADAKKAEALRERDTFAQKNSEFDTQRDALMAKVTADASGQRKRLLDSVRHEAETLRTTQQDALQAENRRLGDEITRRAEAEIFAISRKALSDLASADLEDQIVKVFVRRLRGLSKDDRDALQAAFRAASDPLTVRSAFDLPPSSRAEIEKVVHELVETDAKIHYETAPGIVSGIELSASGWKV